MSTNSNISIVNADGTTRSIYCHWDGGLWDGGVAQTLIEFYRTESEVNELIDHGACSSLGGSVNDSLFYHRDRGEDLDIRINETPNEEYHYTFNNGQWYVCCPETEWADVILTEELRVELEKYDG
ncbi:hypothetical protein VPFG_00290 [Vibrio phage nt-1]|uniref:Uncharacterized protein n=1 Tax=Vibrio phage nt-1 TaxID=115992 RepID=R9TFM8_9CAUD|nr:hypothetical protein VPFG_00290 [Vibrio phage nt-1]AGN30289.2 hypothetical protein VPFG_00290 [Vibrio phage nt-1]